MKIMVNRYRTMPLWRYKYLYVPTFTIRKAFSVVLLLISHLTLWLANILFPELEHRITDVTSIRDAIQYYEAKDKLLNITRGIKGGSYANKRRSTK